MDTIEIKEKTGLSENADFGDARLNKRLEIITDHLSDALDSPIPSAAVNWATTKATYRFFDNKNVNPQAIIEAHSNTFIPQISDEPQRIYQHSDTVDFDYTGKKAADNLGPLNYINRRGLYTHNSLIINSSWQPMGMLHQTHNVRDDDGFGKSAAREKLPFEQKESYRWKTHFDKGQDLVKANPNLEVVYVADREADIMELFAARTNENMHFVIRSKHNRNLVGEDCKLWEKIDQSPITDTYAIKVTDVVTKKKKEVPVNLRFTDVTIQLSPRTYSSAKSLQVNLSVISVEQVAPKQPNKPYIKWVILTTLPVRTVEEARQIIKIYTKRWLIERFHFLLKSGGANVEELQLETAARIQNAISTYTIAAMKVFKLRYIAENQPNTPISEIGISVEEYLVLYDFIHEKIDSRVCFNPDHIPSAEEFCIAMASIVGFLPSKRQKLPGLKVLARAVDKFTLIFDAFTVFMSMN